MSVTSDAAAVSAVAQLLHPVGAVALDHDNAVCRDLNHNAGVANGAAAIEENLIPNLGIVVISPLLLKILRGVDAGGTEIPALALDALTIFTEGLPETPVHEALAPGIAVLVAVVVPGSGKVSGILGPVAAACIGQRVIESGVRGFLPVTHFSKGDLNKLIGAAHVFQLLLRLLLPDLWISQHDCGAVQEHP